MPAPSPSHPHAAAIVLAAGLGTRMKSGLPKAAHPIGGRPMLRHLLASCEQVFGRIAVVIGPGMEALERIAAPHTTVLQQDRLGTGHAARTAEAHFGDSETAILFADNPLITPATLRRLLDARASGAGLALMAMRPADPGRYGRLVTKDGSVQRIVEWKDATEEERAIPLCNAGALAAPAADLRRWLAALSPNNAAGEYYLTDLAASAHAEGRTVAPVEAPDAELRGINSRAELATAEATFQGFMREAAMEAGVTLRAPETVFFSYDTVLGADTVVEPNVVFGPGVTVSGPSEIRAFSHLEGCTVSAGAVIGPYARLRPGTEIGAGAHVGNFVELKATALGEGAKANHLTYLGDSTIGAGTNIGAGTITCNYDGYAKHRTVVGKGVFVGSDSVLVAPITVADGAFVAAGSTLTEDVPADALALGRARQTNIQDRAATLRARLSARKKG